MHWVPMRSCRRRAVDSGLAELLGARVHERQLGRPVWLGGADVVFDCVGSERSLDDALRITRHQGTVVLVGMPGVPRGVDWTSIWHKELVVRGAYTSTTPTFRRALEHVVAHHGAFGAIGIARFPLARYRASHPYCAPRGARRRDEDRLRAVSLRGGRCST